MNCTKCGEVFYGDVFYEDEDELCGECYKELHPYTQKVVDIDPKIKLFSNFIDNEIEGLPKELHEEFLEYCEKNEPLLKFDPQSKDIQKKYVRAYAKIKLSS